MSALERLSEEVLAVTICSGTAIDDALAWRCHDAEARHEKYLRIALDAAKGRALYESPRFAAIAVSAPANEPVH